MNQLVIILAIITAISIAGTKTVISRDQAAADLSSQVRDQSEDDAADEILATAEQVFLPRFTTKRLAERRKAQVQRRNDKKKKKKNTPNRKYSYGTYYYRPIRWNYLNNWQYSQPYYYYNNYRPYYR